MRSSLQRHSFGQRSDAVSRLYVLQGELAMIRTRLAAVLVVLTLGFGQASTSLVQAQERREGINVHGHWVIDIRNPAQLQAALLAAAPNFIEGYLLIVQLLASHFSTLPILDVNH